MGKRKWSIEKEDSVDMIVIVVCIVATYALLLYDWLK